MREGCQFPDNSPSTAYRKGCRCESCRAFRRERSRRYYAANPERELESARRRRAVNSEWVRERGRRYYASNLEKLRERARRYREANSEKARERERRRYEANPGSTRRASERTFATYALAAPAIVTGPYQSAEDAVILSWEGRVIDLAIALGRTYCSVVSRRRRLLTETLA